MLILNRDLGSLLLKLLRDHLRSSSSVRLSAVRHSLHPFLAKAGTLPDHLYNQSTYIILHFSSACKLFFAQLRISFSVFLCRNRRLMRLTRTLYMPKTNFFFSGIDKRCSFDYNKSVASEMQQLNMR